MLIATPVPLAAAPVTFGEEPPKRPWFIIGVMGVLLLGGAAVVYYQARPHPRRRRR